MTALKKGGRKQGSKNSNYHYCVVLLNEEKKIRGRKYYKTYQDLNNYYPMSKSTLWRLCEKDGLTKKYRWNIFEKVNIVGELGDFFNKSCSL